MMVHIQSQHLGGGGRRIMSFSHFQLHAKFKDSLVYSKELLVLYFTELCGWKKGGAFINLRSWIPDAKLKSWGWAYVLLLQKELMWHLWKLRAKFPENHLWKDPKVYNLSTICTVGKLWWRFQETLLIVLLLKNPCVVTHTAPTA